MDPATIVSGVSSLAGALLGRNKQVKPGDVVRQTMAGLIGQARGAREVGEAYGFNPLTLLGVSQPLVPQAVDNSGFGQAIANAGLAVAEGLSAENAQKAYTEKLEEQNRDLRKALDSQTLRPKVAGIFGQPGAASAGVAETVEVPTVPTFGPLPDVPQDAYGNMLLLPSGEAGGAEQVNPLQSEPWYKKVRVGGKDLIGWNDEAAESEVMSTLMALTLPSQLVGRYVFDPAFEPGKGYMRETPEHPSFMDQLYIDFPAPKPRPDSYAGRRVEAAGQ